jgi:hypothetical protein
LWSSGPAKLTFAMSINSTHSNNINKHARYSLPHYVPLKARSVTHPTAIRAAAALCRSFHVVSESTPTPPQGNRTKLFIDNSDNLLASIFCRFIEFVPTRV